MSDAKTVLDKHVVLGVTEEIVPAASGQVEERS